MSKHLERDLESLEREILSQSSVVEEMIVKSFRALCDRQPALCSELVEKEEETNLREVCIEEECLKILALHQPVAVDLRRVATILKINSDLERIADLTVNIAERAIDLSVLPELAVPKNLEKMVEVSTTMVRSSLDAFVDLDADLAREVCGRDDEVDELNREVIDDLYDVIQSESSLVRAALHFFSAARHVERIADHATNIAEDVIYLVRGEIVRHDPEGQQG